MTLRGVMTPTMVGVMTPTRVRYAKLSRQARETIKAHNAPSTIEGYVRYWFPEGDWSGDSCGCPDDRCVGFHHGDSADCGCLSVTLGEYAQTLDLCLCGHARWAHADSRGCLVASEMDGPYDDDCQQFRSAEEK